jgi:RsmE family RNA methyltransferase
VFPDDSIRDQGSPSKQNRKQERSSSFVFCREYPHPMRAIQLIYMTTSLITGRYIASSSAFNAWSRTTTRRIHATSPLRLNRFLFDVNELDLQNVQDDTINNSAAVPTVTLSSTDYRTIHAAKTLKLQNGDSIRAGIVLDRQEELPTIGVNEESSADATDKRGPHSHALTMHLAGTITDEATVTWLPEGKIKKAEPTKNGNPPGSLRIQLDALHMYNPHVENRDDRTEDGSIEPSALDPNPSVSLILALPRPLQLERILPMISQMGVDHLVLCSAQKVPKDYFGSHLFRRPNALRSRLIEGLCQAGDVRLPKITVVKQLKKFIEDDLETLFPSSEVARVIAHPLRKDEAATRMRNVSFPGGLAKRRIVLAVGPEGGWSEPYELDLFKQHSFQQITLGSRVLRSDVAVVSLLSLARDLCAD